MGESDLERRVRILEAWRDTYPERCEGYRSKLWEAVNGMQLEQARQSVKVALIVGAVAAAGNAVIAYLMVALLAR